MPIYGDYHGDFQKSNNSSWDQIQATLKILLPSYQPIPSDSLDELSFHGCDDRSVAVVVQRPPPEPPDLESLSVGDGEQAVAWSYKPEDLMDAATGIHSGAEDSAVAKGNVDNGKAESFSHFLGDDDTADLNCSGCVRDVDEGTRPATSVNIGESTASARSGTEHGAIGTTTDGGLRARRFLSLTPPPLLAAVLPWNRGGEEEVWSHDAWNWTVNTNEEAVDVEDVILVNGTTNDACDSGTHGGRCVPWLAAMVEVSLKREVVVGVAATIGEKGVGVIRFGLLLGLTHTQDLEAHIKEEQAALFNWSSHYNFSAYWRQVQFSAATFFCFRINDGLGYKQWDPGIFFIESNRLVIK